MFNSPKLKSLLNAQGRTESPHRKAIASYQNIKQFNDDSRSIRTSTYRRHVYLILLLLPPIHDNDVVVNVFFNSSLCSVNDSVDARFLSASRRLQLFRPTMDLGFGSEKSRSASRRNDGGRPVSSQLEQRHRGRQRQNAAEWRQTLLGSASAEASVWHGHDGRNRDGQSQATRRRFCQHAWRRSSRMGTQS